MKYSKLTQVETETTNRPFGLKRRKERRRRKRRRRRKQQLQHESTTVESCKIFKAFSGSKVILGTNKKRIEKNSNFNIIPTVLEHRKRQNFPIVTQLTSFSHLKAHREDKGH